MSQIYRANYSIPDERLHRFRGNPDDVKNSARRDLISDMLVKMSEAGEDVSDYIIRFTERRQERLGFDGYMVDRYARFGGGYETIIEISAIPLEQARDLLGRR